MKAHLVSTLSLALASTFALASADPAGDSIRQELSEPFCYFKAPTDQIGFKNCPKATVVTPDGAFLSAYGELSFYAGAPKTVRPVRKRVKTLVDGYLPIIQYRFDRDGLTYRFEAFATPIALDPRNDLITFVRCTVSNPGKKSTKGVLGVNFGDMTSKINIDPTYDWSNGQRVSLYKALGAQRSTVWHSKPFLDESKFNGHLNDPGVFGPYGDVQQGGHLVFASTEPLPVFQMPSFPSKLKGAAEEYDFSLQPGERKSFTFKMPAVPIKQTNPVAIAQVLHADYNDYRKKTVAFWKDQVALASRFIVDDPKVMNTFKTSLVNDLVASELNSDGNIYQRVNKIHYNYMWIRDSSFFVRTYDMLGLPKTASDALRDFMVWKDGKVVSFFKPGAPQPDGARLSVQDDYWGQVLWAVGAHCRTTGDVAFLRQVYPLLGPHIDEFVAKCKADPRGLWPVAGPYDNEAINGHYTGHSFWALLGLKYAVYMAKQMHRPDDAAKWQLIHDDYQANFMKQLRELTAKSDCYIPPGMDNVNDGNDWDNASGGLYPFEVIGKKDPLAVTTLRTTRDFNYQEGIMTYGGNAWVAKQLKKQGKTAARGTLHHYETFYVTESNTILGEQRKVVEDLYSILAHTGSTNSGFEFCIPAWSTRDPMDNFTPHGWFASRYMSQIRDALVREEGSDLHLASVLAPQWVQPGRHVKVTEAPTFFGSVTYDLHCGASGATLTLANRWKPGSKPANLILHTPWFVKVSSAIVDGRPIATNHGTLKLPLNAKQVLLRWHWTEHPDLSYDRAVRLFLEKYYRKPAGANYDFLFQ
jgi:hypothetical protein